MRVFLLLSMLAGCKHAPPSSPGPVDVELVVGRALATGAALASIAAATSAANEDGPACLVWSSSSHVGGMASDLLMLGPVPGVFPALSIDVSPCVELLEVDGVDVGPLVEVALDAVLREASALAVGRVSCPVDAGLRWVRGAAPAILDELENPDGVVEVFGVDGGCG
jgi:hypothetical protein